MVNTVLAMAGGGIFASLFDFLGGDGWPLPVMVNGQLAGAVAVCAGANVFKPWAALLVGIVAGATMVAWSRLLVRWRIDDAVDAVGVHLGAGAWGVIARPLLARQTGVMYSAVGVLLPYHA